MKYKHITIAGDLGSGKSTVGKILCAKLNMKSYSTGVIQREFAFSKGLTVLQLNMNIQNYPEIDSFIDNSLIALNEKEDSLVIDSRMAWHFVKNSLKVFLSCDLNVAAERVFADHRSGENTESVEETKAALAERKRCEEARYLELYGVHISEKNNYDLVINSTVKTPEEVAQIIIEAYTAQ